MGRLEPLPELALALAPHVLPCEVLVHELALGQEFGEICIHSELILLTVFVPRGATIRGVTLAMRLGLGTDDVRDSLRAQALLNEPKPFFMLFPRPDRASHRA